MMQLGIWSRANTSESDSWCC